MSEDKKQFNWDDHPIVVPADVVKEKEDVDQNGPGILDTIKEHAKAVGKQYLDAGEKAKKVGEGITDFTNAAGRGAVSAATPLTGLSTEKLAGGVGALGDVVTGDNPLPKSLSLDEIKAFGKRMGVSYDEAKKFAEKYKQTEEQRSPYLSTAGQLGGGLVGGGALMKGVGAVAPALSELGSGKAVGNALGVAEEGGGLGGVAARTGAKAVEGAPLGAVYGLDNAQGGNTQEKLEGAGKGALMGSGVGLLAGLGYEGGKALKGAYEASKTLGNSNQTARQLNLARQVAREGVTTPTGEKITSIYSQPMGQGGAMDITKSADDTAKAATDKLYGARKGLQTQYGDVLDQLDEQGVTLTPKSDDLLAINQTQNTLQDLPGLFGDRGQIQQTRDLLNKFQQGSLLPSEAKQLQMNLRKAAGNSSAKNLGAEQSKIESAVDGLTDHLNNLPEPQNGGQSYQDVNDLYRDYSGTMGSLANKGEIDPNYVDKWVSDLNNRSDIKKVMSQMIDFVQKPGSSGDEKRLVLEKVANHFNDLEKSQPGFLKSQGVDFNTIKKNINDMSDLVNLSKQARLDRPETNPISRALGAASPLAATVVGKAETAVPRFTKQLFNLPNETLRSITPDLPEHVSSALTNAINTGDQAKRNAVLFSIVQNPDLRKRINKRLGVVEE
jgi:hypothetical protein